jgi:fumarate hydratase, class II
LLAAAARNFTEQCIKGIQATTRGPEMVERGLAIGTALAPVIGYDAAANIAKEAAKTGKTIREVAREKTNLTEEALDRILDPANMTKPGLEGGPAGG